MMKNSISLHKVRRTCLLLLLFQQLLLAQDHQQQQQQQEEHARRRQYLEGSKHDNNTELTQLVVSKQHHRHQHQQHEQLQRHHHQHNKHHNHQHQNAINSAGATKTTHAHHATSTTVRPLAAVKHAHHYHHHQQQQHQHRHAHDHYSQTLPPIAGTENVNNNNYKRLERHTAVLYDGHSSNYKVAANNWLDSKYHTYADDERREDVDDYSETELARVTPNLIDVSYVVSYLLISNTLLH